MPVNEGDIINQLEGLGTNRSTAKMVDDAVQIAIIATSEQAIEKARSLLINKGTGALAQSITLTPTTVEGDVYTFTITADDYYDYVDKGVNGLSSAFTSPYQFKHPRPSRKHVEAIKSWIPAAGLTIGSGSHPSIKTYDQLAWAVATAVKQHGIKPTNFIEQSFGAGFVSDMTGALRAALGKTVEIKFQQIATKANGPVSGPALRK